MNNNNEEIFAIKFWKLIFVVILYYKKHIIQYLKLFDAIAALNCESVSSNFWYEYLTGLVYFQFQFKVLPSSMRETANWISSSGVKGLIYCDPHN